MLRPEKSVVPKARMLAVTPRPEKLSSG